MPDQISGFTSLHTTCSSQLPVEPLLRAVIVCGTQARVDAINANDYSSWSAMQAAGWTWDDAGDEESNGCCFPGSADRGTRGAHNTGQDCGSSYFNWAANEKVGTLSLVLPVSGNGLVDFGDCSIGMVSLAINGVQVETASPHTDSVVASIKFQAGDVLTLQDVSGGSIIRLNSIELVPVCGIDCASGYSSGWGNEYLSGGSHPHEPSADVGHCLAQGVGIATKCGCMQFCMSHGAHSFNWRDTRGREAHPGCRCYSQAQADAMRLESSDGDPWAFCAI